MKPAAVEVEHLIGTYVTTECLHQLKSISILRRRTLGELLREAIGYIVASATMTTYVYQLEMPGGGVVEIRKPAGLPVPNLVGQNVLKVA